MNQVSTVYREPFELGSPEQMFFAPGVSVAGIIGRMDCLPPDFGDTGRIFIDQVEVPRALWAAIKPKGGVTLTDVIAPVSYRIVGEGKGGVAGFAKGAANVTLADVEGGTELTYHVDAKVGGKLAQLGSRIVGGFAKKMADAFFENFQNAVEDPPA